jgi:CMP-N,N'-diacetyllegionaminic acid synthase
VCSSTSRRKTSSAWSTEIVRVARHYVLCIEYFSHQPVQVPYRGHARASCSSGTSAASTWSGFPGLRVLDYGFLWQPLDSSDDSNWWLFAKRVRPLRRQPTDRNRGRVLGLIPAKGGSVRVARKNLRPLGGPLAAVDDRGRARARLPRPPDGEHRGRRGGRRGARQSGRGAFPAAAALARDPYGVVDVCLHALDELESAGERFDHLVVLLPTSPFRTSRHIGEALRQYRALGAEFLMSVTRLDHSLLAAHVLQDDYMQPLHPEWIGKLGARANKAELPELVKANGAVTIVNVARLRETRTYYSYPLAAFPMPWPDSNRSGHRRRLPASRCAARPGRISVPGMSVTATSTTGPDGSCADRRFGDSRHGASRAAV